MFDNGETPPEARVASASEDTVTMEPPSATPPRRATKAPTKSVKPIKPKKKVVTPQVTEDLTLYDPEEKLYYVIELRKIIAEKKAEKDTTGRLWVTIQSLARKLVAAMNDLAPKEISYSNPFEVALPPTTPVLGGHLEKRTYFDAGSN